MCPVFVKLVEADMSLLNWAVSLLNIQANPAEQSHLPVGAASGWNGLKRKEVNLTQTYLTPLHPSFSPPVLNV